MSTFFLTYRSIQPGRGKSGISHRKVATTSCVLLSPPPNQPLATPETEAVRQHAKFSSSSPCSCSSEFHGLTHIRIISGGAIRRAMATFICSARNQQGQAQQYVLVVMTPEQFGVCTIAHRRRPLDEQSDEHVITSMVKLHHSSR